MVRYWLKRWGRKPEAIAETIQNMGLVRAAWLLSRSVGESPPDADHLPNWLVEVLAAAMARMCHYEDDAMPDPLEMGRDEGGALAGSAMARAQAFLGGMPASTRVEFQSLLVLMEFSPYVFGPRRLRFTQLNERERDVVLQGWESSSILARRAGFKAVKSVVMMGYWTRAEAFASIGYSVAENPGVPQPQREQWQRREKRGDK